MSVTFATFNIGIALAYVTVAITVIPHLDIHRRWVVLAAMVFFATCGFTHADMAAHAIFDAWPTAPSVHSFTNHAVQVAATWVFVVGLYLEFVVDKGKGPW